MHARGAVLDGLDGVLGFGAHGLGDMFGVGLDELFQRFDGDLAANGAADFQAGVRCEVDDFGRVEGLGDLGREEVGIDAEGFAVGSEGDRRDDGHDLLGDEFAEKIFVDSLDFARELLIHALNDAEGKGANRVGDDGLQRILGEAFQNEM